MWTKSHIALVLLGAFLFTAPVRAQDIKIPKLLRHVADFTNTLSQGELDALDQNLKRFEDSTSTQLTVVMVPTIGDESIEDFALRTAETNGLGQKKRDNGVLLLVVKDDHKIRIEVGYGLEGVLPDGLAGQIIRREITPNFRQGNYFAGIKAGTDAIMLATQNEYKADKKASRDDGLPPIAIILFVMFLFFIVMSRSRRRGALMGASGLPIFYGGGWGGGSSRSGGGGFGGFSGGGGSFGGGGASGSW